MEKLVVEKRISVYKLDQQFKDRTLDPITNIVELSHYKVHEAPKFAKNKQKTKKTPQKF